MTDQTKQIIQDVLIDQKYEYLIHVYFHELRDFCQALKEKYTAHIESQSSLNLIDHGLVLLRLTKNRS